jgi:hypothetical protein
VKIGSMNTFSSTVLLIGVAFIAFVAGGAPVEAHPGSYSVTGDVRDRASNAPLTAAIVVLASDQGMTIGSTATDASGRFALRVTPVHRLRLRITTVGYRVAEIALDDHTAPSLIHVLLERGGATQIGRSRSRTNAAAADSDGRLSSATLADEGALRVTDALKAQSGVTVVGDASAPGGDAYVSVRGLRPGETRTLLDGHPIGPIGVAPDTPDTDGSIGGFNFQDAPYFALRGIDVTSGGTDPAAMRSDSIGGAIDLLTISPTTADVVTIDGGVGNEKRGVSSLRATGTIGKLGYVVVDGVSGTTGVFPGAPITQAGLRGTDFTSATRSALTYDVSGDYLLRNGLLKVGYSPIPSTSVLVTSYAATSWADKTGEGDNDFLRRLCARKCADRCVGALSARRRGDDRRWLRLPVTQHLCAGGIRSRWGRTRCLASPAQSRRRPTHLARYGQQCHRRGCFRRCVRVRLSSRAVTRQRAI